MARQLINSFNGGEYSEELLGRVDLEAMRKACRICRNFIPRTLGGVRRRPGLLRVGAAKHADKKCRLLPFNFSTTSRFIMELGNGYLRFWKDGAQVVDGGAAIIDLTAPWTEAQLFEIQMTQVNDLVFFTHPDFPVQELRRVTDISWTLAEFEWNWPAMRDPNIETTTMTPSVTTGTGTLTASAAHFTAQDVGAYYQITHRRSVPSVSLDLTTDAASAALTVLGDWEVITFGEWAGNLVLESKDAGGAWKPLRSWIGTTAGERNIQATGRVEEVTEMRFNFDYLTHTDDPRAQLSAIDPELHGLVKVTGYTSPTVVNVTVVRALAATSATLQWAEGAWSTRRGHPRSCAIHQQRLIFGGNRDEPQKLWGSAINDFNNFQPLSFADSSFTLLVAAQEANPIVWLASQDGLIIGTEGDEWLMDSGDEIISATNPPFVKRKTKIGSADIQAQLVGSVVLFVQRGGTAMREYVFAFDEQGYKAPELTQLADHLTREGIRQFCFAQNPDSLVWVVTEDGRLLSCTYRRESEVVGWARHDTAGEFESVACIYGAEDSDEIWVSVKRTIGSVTSRHIERFDPQHWLKLMRGEAHRAEITHFDCAVRVTSEENISTVTGLTHLNGATVGVRVDGAGETNKLVASGQITLNNPGTEIVVGLPYTSELQPFLFDTQLPDGTAQSLMQRTVEFKARLLLTGAFSYKTNPEAETTYHLEMRKAEHPMESPPPLFTGLTGRLHVMPEYEDGVNLVMSTGSGEPLNILMLVSHTGIHAR